MRSPQRIWLGRPLEFVRGNSVGLRETQTPLLKGTHKVSCIPGPSGKKQWPHKNLSQTYLLVSQGFLQRPGVAIAHCWDMGLSLAVIVLENIDKGEPSWRPPLSHLVLSTACRL